MQLDKDRVLPIIKAALKEDIGAGDVTTGALVDSVVSSDAALVTREDCVVCGLEIAEWAMSQVDYSVRFKPNCKDGTFVGAGKELAFIEGHTSSILRAERVMINFVAILSGIATKTKRYVDIAKPHNVRIMDTRKTIPLLRYLEKYAVFTGGGINHRMGLYDQVLIKDNHIANVRRQGKDIAEAVRMARKRAPKDMKIEVEVESIDEFNSVLAVKPDIVLLDNMSPDQIKACVEIRRLAKHKVLLEVSGGITLDTVEKYAATGIDMISVGELTDSVHGIDMSLEMM